MRLARSLLPILALALLGAGCQARPEAVVLFSTATPAMRAALPAARCAYYPVEGFVDPGVRARTVVVAGHSEPPLYLGQAPAAIARAVAAFRPELVVLDTCYGASSPLLEALTATGLAAWVVAPPYRIPLDGFVYEPGFLAAGPAEARARRVSTAPPYPLLRWRLDARELAAVREEAAALPASTLRRRLRRLDPPMVALGLATGLEPEGRVLVPVEPARLVEARP